MTPRGPHTDTVRWIAAQGSELASFVAQPLALCVIRLSPDRQLSTPMVTLPLRGRWSSFHDIMLTVVGKAHDGDGRPVLAQGMVIAAPSEMHVEAYKVSEQVFAGYAAFIRANPELCGEALIDALLERMQIAQTIPIDAADVGRI